MAKKRVYELAKDLGLSNKEMVDWLRAHEYDIKSHSSSLEDDQAPALAAVPEPKPEVAPPPPSRPAPAPAVRASDGGRSSLPVSNVPAGVAKVAARPAPPPPPRPHIRPPPAKPTGPIVQGPGGV